jgi:lipopolysaccharide biosynthesis protein
MNKVAILTHIYYDNSFEHLKKYLLNFKEYETTYLFNISLDCLEKELVISNIRNVFPEAVIIETPNIGKDIGGKLALIDLYLRLHIQSDFMIFLHDKLSPQALNGEEWRDKLLKIIEKDHIKTIFDIYENDPKAGMVGNKECIFSEYVKEKDVFSTVNNDLLKIYSLKYNIGSGNYEFIAGTMFWSRSSIIEKFFSNYSPLEMRKNLERGNVLDNFKGTHTHTIERLLGFLAGTYGYKIYGI